jgi:hypothetical protein
MIKRENSVENGQSLTDLQTEIDKFIENTLKQDVT